MAVEIQCFVSLQVQFPAAQGDDSHICCIFKATVGRDRPLVWRSPVLSYDEFVDVSDVHRLLLSDKHEGSDTDVVIVDTIHIEVITRPTAPGLREDYAARADARERKAVELMAALNREMAFGAFDQARIERSRPNQTEAWYQDRQNRGLLRMVRNLDNNRCLEYAICMYNKEQELLRQHWAAGDHAVVKKNGEVVMTAKQQARDPDLKAPAKSAFSNYARSFGPRSFMSREAKEIERKVWGNRFDDVTHPRTLNDLVRYHNKLKIRLLVHTHTYTYTHIHG
jgi:hypothetical protein